MTDRREIERDRLRAKRANPAYRAREKNAQGARQACPVWPLERLAALERANMSLPDLVLVPPARSPHPEIIEAFEIRSWARAYLASVGAMDFHEAVDSLQELAVGNGLVERLGQDGVQDLMASQFEAVRSTFCGEPAADGDHDEACAVDRTEGSPMAEYRLVAHDGVASAAEMQREYDRATRRERLDHGLASSTLEAFRHVRAENDLERIRSWLARRAPDERAQLRSAMVVAR